MLLTATPSDAGQRLDVFVQRRLPEHSRARIQEWIKQGRVLVEGRPGKASLTLRGGESVQVEPCEPPPLTALPENLPVEVLYEDPAVLAVNKPAGLAVHPGAGRHSGTLANALVHHFASLSQLGGGLRPGIVHRLDRETSGVLLVARNDAAHRRLAAQFLARSVEKVYLALVHGEVKGEAGRIDKPVARDPLRRTRMTTRLAGGRAALTEYRVLDRFPGFTYLEVRIGTGRTHQIRVHLASIGHPVAGDRLYGAPASARGRFFLHAHRIAFKSPATGEIVRVAAPLPPELEGWVAELAARRAV